MCVVAAAEKLVCGAERPMDEEDAAAPVGGDRGRGPGGLGSPRSLRREAGVLGGGFGVRGGACAPVTGLPASGPSSALVPGLGRLSIIAVTSRIPGPPGLV